MYRIKISFNGQEGYFHQDHDFQLLPLQDAEILHDDEFLLYAMIQLEKLGYNPIMESIEE